MLHPFVASIREIREQAKVSKTAAAALANVSPGTWRAYELDRAAVTKERQARCDETAAKLLEMVRSRSQAA